MKVVVLLSAGLHPVSGRPVLPRIEAQAIALAQGLERVGAEVCGLHAGPEAGLPREALGHGLSRLVHRESPAGADPVPALAAALAEAVPDLVLAGRRGEGGEDTGLVPYLLAETLGLPLVADLVAIEGLDAAPPAARFEQIVSGTTRRRFTRRLPVLATVHPRAPDPLPFAFARMRRGTVERLDGAVAETHRDGFEERPYRLRPKLMRRAGPGASAPASETVIVDPTPEEAARLILDHLERLGIRRFGPDGR